MPQTIEVARYISVTISLIEKQAAVTVTQEATTESLKPLDDGKKKLRKRKGLIKAVLDTAPLPWRKCMAEGAVNPLYLKMHRIVSGEQLIKVVVPRKPTQGGIDPNFLMIDIRVDDNVMEVE